MIDFAEISELSQKTLDQIYVDFNILYKQLEIIECPSTSTEYQCIVNRGLQLGQYLWDSVEKLSLFSNNENIDDITTESLKFLSIPAIISYFHYNKINKDRLNTLEKVKEFNNRFIELMKDYKFKDVNEEFGQVVESREEKINRFKSEKVSKERFIQLEKYINQENVEDEIKREYYIASIKQWISKIKNDYKMLNDEIYLLENKDDIEKELEIKEVPKGQFKPFVITSEMIKQSVFGMGYKSLPKYSLEEYYIKQVEMGHLPDPNVDYHTPSADGSTVRRIIPDERLEEEKMAERNDELEDSHDIESRLKKIGMDNYKDENRRGCGSTMNRG